MQAPAFSAHQKEDEREEGYYQIVLPFLDAFFITNLKLISFNELHDMAFTLWWVFYDISRALDIFLSQL